MRSHHVLLAITVGAFVAACSSPPAAVVDRAGPLDDHAFGDETVPAVSTTLPSPTLPPVSTAPPAVPPTVPPTSSPTVPPTSSPTATVPFDRSTSVGDRRLPTLGASGLDVAHYDVDLSYDPGEPLTLDSTVTISGRVTDATDQLSFDLDGPAVTDATVDGRRVDVEQRGRDLIVPLSSPLAAGDEFTATFDVRARLTAGGLFGDLAGVFVSEGGLWSVNEPDGTSTWLPVNDHPTDKATWTFEVTVPNGLTGVANGRLVGSEEHGSTTTWTWDQDEPMASYLVLLLVGRYDLVDDGTTPSGVELRHAVLADQRDDLDPYLDLTRRQIALFEELVGPYPFERYGVAITDSQPGLAMETQGMSLFSGTNLDGRTDELQQMLLAHELAHQWFGDAVSPATWDDIWLNEGFATYFAWIWLDHVGIRPIDASAGFALRSLPPGGGPLSRPDELFGAVSYDRGGAVLHALRRTVGDEAFFDALRAWVATYHDGSATTDDFQRVVEQASGTDLDDFFATWVHAADVPRDLPPVGGNTLDDRTSVPTAIT